MPYASVASLPAPVKAKLSGKKLRQWMHVFNSAYDKHGDESRAFAEAWATVKKAVSGKISKEAAGYKGQTTDNEHCSNCTMFVKPRGCTLVEGDIAPGAWCEHYERDKTLGKANSMSQFQFFLPIAKVDQDKRTVSGYASTPTKDADGEIVTLDAVKQALPDYMQWGNIREMHKLSAVGVAEEANVDNKGLFLTAKIIDDGAWKKCLEGVYKGFSIGGRKLDKVGNKITEIEMTEISVVDRPANPDAKFTLAKSAKTADDTVGGYLVKVKAKPTPEQRALRKMAKVVDALTKAGNPPAAHDGFSLPAKKAEGATGGPNDSRPGENITRKGDGPTPCEAHGKIDCPDCVQKGGDAPGEGDKPYGNVKYADPGYQSDKKKRYPLDNEDHIRAAWNYINKPKNAGKYSPADAAKVKAAIVAEWKATIDKEGPPSAKDKSKAKADAKKLAKRRLQQALDINGESFLFLKSPKLVPEPLRKGMNSAGSLAYCFDSIRQAQRSLMIEAKREGGDMKDKALAKELGSVAQRLASVISQKAEHEGSEALDLSDVDDQYLTSILGEDFDMEKVTQNAGGSGDPLADAIAVMMKRAATPSRNMRMAMAKAEIKKARKAAKDARDCIQQAHKMHKAAYMSKAAKKPDDKDADDGFDHAGAMEKLQKAYAAVEKALTFGKAASNQIEKASRSGQRGQEAGDPDAPFYEVPPGVKDLTPEALATASPGGDGSGSSPPLYPSDGSVYAGKADASMDLKKYAKNGVISADVAELMLKAVKAEGELEALRRLPAGGNNGRRPYTFDMTKIVAGNGNGNGNMGKALFDGVDPNALGSGDENAHNGAAARLIGNFLTSGHFGKSVFDPAFKGAAGSGK